MPHGEEIANRVEAAATAIAALKPDLEAGEPWPLAADFGPGPEASWGPPEVLAHVAEMLPYWLDQAETLMANDGSPIAFGRTATDPARLLAIENDRRLPIADLIARVEAAAGRYRERLSSVPDSALEHSGNHPVRGEMSAGQVLELFAAAHAEDHLEQLRAASRTG